MRIVSGYSEEIYSNNWARGDVELDSSDLENLAIDHGFDLSGLTLAQKYGILSSEVERLVTVKYIRDIQTKYPGARDMAALKNRLTEASNRVAEYIELAKKVSSGGSREENS